MSYSPGTPDFQPQPGSQLSGSSGQASAPQFYPGLAWNIELEIERKLPQPGEVLVTAGQRVDSDTLVARTLIPGRPKLFNLADFFDADPDEVARWSIKPTNSQVTAGQVVVQRKGLLGKQFKAPFDAIVSAFDPVTGYLSLTPAPAPFSLEAYVSGVVSEVMPGLGVKISLRGGYARGFFGIGGEKHGVLKTLTSDPNEPVDPAQIEPRTNNFILLGGSFIRAEALRKAVEMRVRGIICGSISYDEVIKFLEFRNPSNFYRVGSHGSRFPADINASESPLTLIITEGFGQKGMANPVFEMLLANDGLPISINGTTGLRRRIQRPEIIIPKSGLNNTNHPLASLNPEFHFPRIGSTVRLINPSYTGMVGRVTNLSTNRRIARPGQQSRLAQIDVNGTRLVVPLVDLEVLQQPTQ